MKTILTALLLTIATFVAAQDYDYEYSITNNLDSTFDLSITRQITDNSYSIEKLVNIDTTRVREKLYSEINSAYEEIAKLQKKIDDRLRYRSKLLLALRSVDIENYMEDIAKRLSLKYSYNWVYSNSNGETDELYGTYLENTNRTVMRSSIDTVPVTNIAVIIPYSYNNILYRFLPAGTNDVNMYSNDGRIFTGRDDEGVRHVLIKRNY